MTSTMQKCTIWAQVQGWSTGMKTIIIRQKCIFSQDLRRHSFASVPHTQICISTGFVSSSYRLRACLQTRRLHQSTSSCNYCLIIATSQIIIRGWQKFRGWLESYWFPHALTLTRSRKQDMKFTVFMKVLVNQTIQRGYRQLCHYHAYVPFWLFAITERLSPACLSCTDS